MLVNQKGDSEAKWSRKEWLWKIGPLKMPLFTSHCTSLEHLWKTWVLFTSVWYHHRKSFTWLLSLKFVTQESPRRIFKPENELPDRIITFSPNIHHRHLSGKCSRSFSKQRTNSRQARAPQWGCRAPLWACPTLLWACNQAPQPRPTPSRVFIQVRVLEEEKNLSGTSFTFFPLKSLYY